MRPNDMVYIHYGVEVASVFGLNTQSPSERGDGDCAFSLAALKCFGFNSRPHTRLGLMDSRRYRAGGSSSWSPAAARRLPRVRGAAARQVFTFRWRVVAPQC
jgi:hypothetical protein